VNEQDLDWQVYHLLLKDPDQGMDSLAGTTGCSSDEIASSLRRLEAACLIEQDGEGFRVPSVQEILLKCQARYDPNSMFVVERGIIRLKKDPDHD
jgi:predicted transcriptional regulator